MSDITDFRVTTTTAWPVSASVTVTHQPSGLSKQMSCLPSETVSVRRKLAEEIQNELAEAR